jgi:protein TonB
VRAFFLSNALLRSAPVVASAVLHVGVAAGLAMGAGGHGRAPAGDVPTTIEIELAPAEVTPPTPPAPAAPAAAREVDPEPRDVTPPPTHTHDYPVPPSHDAQPHDPSIVHDHDAPPAPSADPTPAAASPAITSDAPAELPRFTLASGSGAPSAAHRVASSGTGTGATGGVAASPEPVLPESAVSVAATLMARAAAAYPPAARMDDLEADVPLEIVVDTTGSVVDARVLARAGSGFDESALAAIRRYRFSPAQREGRPVRVRMRWSVQFRLR